MTFAAPLVKPVALTVSGVYLALALLHLYWVVGGVGTGGSAVPERDGKPLFRPGPLSTLGVALLLVTAAGLVIERAGLGPGLLSSAISTVGTWGVAVCLVARAVGEFRYVGFFKRVRGTRFATLDSRYYSPLALLLGVGTAYVAACGPAR